MGVERAGGGSLLLVPCQSIPRSSSAPDVHSKFTAPAVGGTRWVRGVATCGHVVFVSATVCWMVVQHCAFII